MSDTAILVKNLSKRYDIGRVHSLFSRTGRRTEVDRSLWALSDVSLEIKMGEVVGIIGRNGAGKSTFLKILSRITEPTSGYVEIRGRLSSLLEVGSGFHPELTGRENIFLNGAIMGMKEQQIIRRFDEIVAFAEVERFIDTPIKRYSSGMYVRLAFAVAAHLEPDILLIDEVLAVGDSAFQRKCLGTMDQAAKRGRTILFVSHNIAAIESLCRVAYMFEHGKIVKYGETAEVIEAYVSSGAMLSRTPLSRRADRRGTGRVRFTHFELRSDNNPIDAIQSGKDVEFVVEYTTDGGALKNVEVSIDLFTQAGQCMLIMNNRMVGSDFECVPEAGRISCKVKSFPLAPGRYYITLFCTIRGTIADWIQEAVYLTVEAGDFYGTGSLPPASHGGFLVRQAWECHGHD
jgi:homopolymeric O-antigen transport system ATP-binding protein